MNTCTQVHEVCSQIILAAASTDLNTFTAKAAAYFGITVITVIGVIMAVTMGVHYGKREYPRLALSAIVGLLAIWGIGHITNAGTIMGGTFGGLISG